MKTQAEYNKAKTKILNKKNVSDMEKGNLLFGNWINYIFESTSQAERQNLKYESERIRVRI